MSAHFTRGTEDGKIVVAPACEVKMVGGGVQLRYKLPTGGKVSISEAPPEGRVEKYGHYHRGLTEVYVVHSGWIEVVHLDSNKKPTILKIEEESAVYVAKPGAYHLISQGPGAVFTVQTIGTPMPNPERNNNDWYPASKEFNFAAAQLLLEEGTAAF